MNELMKLFYFNEYESIIDFFINQPIDTIANLPIEYFKDIDTEKHKTEISTEDGIYKTWVVDNYFTFTFRIWNIDSINFKPIISIQFEREFDVIINGKNYHENKGHDNRFCKINLSFIKNGWVKTNWTREDIFRDFFIDLKELIKIEKQNEK